MLTDGCRQDPEPGEGGFTLVELLVFMVVVAIGLVALLRVFDHSVTHSVDPIIQVRALECAQAKMDEVLARRFDQASPSGGVPACGSASPGAVGCAGISADASLNDVGDYHATVDNSFANCSVSVTVTEAGSDLGLANAQARRVTVTALSDGGAQVVLSSYRANF